MENALLARIEETRAPERPPLRVLIVDDQAATRRLLRRSLSVSVEFEIVGEAGDGEEGLALVGALHPDVVLVDLDMPRLDGTGMIRAMRAQGMQTCALVLTANGDADHISRAIEAGADGYVLKGCRSEEVRAAVREVGRGGSVLAPRVARSVVNDYVHLLEEKRQRDLAVIRTLANAVEARDECTGDHCHNVARLGLELWRARVGTEPEDDLIYGFLLHDIGKISIPDAVLLKKGSLEPHEVEIMRRHVEIGVDLVSPLGFRGVVTDVIRCHHERFDGAGYPNGLRGEEIPLHARVFSIVDAYDAMTSDRPYRRGMAGQEALEELARASGTQFDPECVEAFRDLARSL